jgi:hypothetical protein
MTGSESERLTLFDFDSAEDLAATDTMSMPVLTDPEVGTEPLVEWAGSIGHVVKVLHRGEGDDGMSLGWSWFGPGDTLRHSHRADCLYDVVEGEARLGNRVVHAGSGSFVPVDAPYASSSGPDGIEILEVRGATSFGMIISENAASFERIVEGVRANRDAWAEGAAAHT